MLKNTNKKYSVFDPSCQEKEIDAKIIAGIERISEILRTVLFKEGTKEVLSPTQVQILIYLFFKKKQI